MIELTNPFILELGKYESFSEYFKTLGKRSKNSLLGAIKKNEDVEYKRIENPGLSELQVFMDMWALQPLANGEFPLWGRMDAKFVLEYVNSICEVLLFSASYNGEIIGIHFVFKWGDYVYCNAPLYNKEKFKKREIAKFMWLNLISYGISEGWEYIDFGASPVHKNSWLDVLEHREGSNDSGDFGYKWKFIPENIKRNHSDIIDYSIAVCEVCNYKGVEFNEHKLECRCKTQVDKLLIVAHPDDESIFFGDWLIKNSNRVKVVSISGGLDSIRKKEFSDVMKNLRIKEFEIWNHEYSLEPFIDPETIESELYRLKFENTWTEVVTHNMYGEYGHLQHIEIHDLVKKIFRSNRISIYAIGAKRLDEKRIGDKMNLCKIHESQMDFGISEIKTSLATGSDWYKHSVGHNMIDFESIAPLFKVKDKLDILYIDPEEYSDFPLYDRYRRVIDGLIKRGHNMYRNSTNMDIDVCLAFTLNDAICHLHHPLIFISLDAEIQDIDVMKTVTTNTIRSIFTNYADRDSLGNPNNIVTVTFDDRWSSVIKKIESNIFMGITAHKLSKNAKIGSFDNFTYDGFFAEFPVVHFSYNGDLDGPVDLLLIVGSIFLKYEIYLGQERLWISFDPDWLGKEITLSISRSSDLLWTQEVTIDKN